LAIHSGSLRIFFWPLRPGSRKLKGFYGIGIGWNYFFLTFFIRDSFFYWNYSFIFLKKFKGLNFGKEFF